MKIPKTSRREELSKKLEPSVKKDGLCPMTDAEYLLLVTPGLTEEKLNQNFLKTADAFQLCPSHKAKEITSYTANALRLAIHNPEKAVMIMKSMQRDEAHRKYGRI